MMNFNFRLERVLNFKESIEELKKAEYGTVQQKLNQEEDKLEKINYHKIDIKNQKNLSTTKTKVGNLALFNDYIVNLEKKIKAQEKVVYKTELELEKAKEEMKLAVQEKKTFEKLKEKEYEKHLYQMKKMEEKQVDTIVNFRTSTQQ
ncbi:MAG: flagellar export protein FliJ [Tissierellia bacterium]|nr:flagellar export protein FliJ [Tissierellia bacterium]